MIAINWRPEEWNTYPVPPVLHSAREAGLIANLALHVGVRSSIDTIEDIL